MDLTSKGWKWIAGMSQAQRMKLETPARTPAIAKYISGWGWIEVGDVDDFRKSRDRGIVARALDGGGMVWESRRPCKDAGDAFQKLELALRKKLSKTTENSALSS